MHETSLEIMGAYVMDLSIESSLQNTVGTEMKNVMLWCWKRLRNPVIQYGPFSCSLVTLIRMEDTYKSVSIWAIGTFTSE